MNSLPEPLICWDLVIVKPGECRLSTSTVFDVFVSLFASIVAVFVYGFSSAANNTCSHVNVSISPAFNDVSPAGRMPEHFVSFNAENFKVVFPVFFTTTWYSTFFPASELNFAVVNEPSPAIRCSLWISNFGSPTSTSTGGVSFSFSPPFTIATFL